MTTEPTPAAPAPEAAATPPPPAPTTPDPAGTVQDAPSADTAPPGAGPAVAPPSWTEYRAAAIKDADLLKQAERFQSVEDLVKGNVELRRQLSNREGLVRVPGEKATPEEVAAWRKATGVPDDPAGYAIAAPEGADDAAKDRLGRFAKEMHGKGAPRPVVEAALGFLSQEAQAIQARQQEAEVAAREQAEATLRQRWGSDYTRNAELAARAFEHLASPELRQFVDGSKLGDHPGMVELFAKVGTMIAEDVPAIAAGKAAIETEFTTIMAERDKRLSEGTVNDPAFQTRWAAAWQRRYG